MADSDFGDGSDRVSYRVPLSSSGPLTLKAALRYQPLSAGYLRDLFRDAELPLVARLQRLWGKAEVRAETLAEAEVQVTR
jgi:hypothetical protein